MTAPADTMRADTAAMLRAVADLIETAPGIPVPRTSIDFYLRGEDTPQTMTAIASALPCQWQASISRSRDYEWLNLRSTLPGRQVTISAPAADACAPAGAKTITVWQPADALRGLIGAGPLTEEA